jgi:hypothetical protein
MTDTIVYYCPRSCHNGRTYPSLDAVKAHVQDQHPDHDPNWTENPYTDDPKEEVAHHPASS